MEIVNTTPYRFHPFDCSVGPELPALSLIVKGTFKLQPEEPAVAVDANFQQALRGDETYMDDLGRSLCYASDLVAFKQRAEVFVNATCHVEGGRPRTECDVSIAVGPVQKTLRVCGDRRWSKSASATAPEPFVKMPIRWERAFGALDLLENPLGRGVDKVPSEDGTDVVHLPNVEYPSARVTSVNDRPAPAGFGPLSPNWLPRWKRQGTRDARWAAFRAPLAPLDFDPRSNNAAPDDQQLDDGCFFRGDEKITLTNLHPELTKYASALPSKRLRVFLSLRTVPGAPPAESDPTTPTPDPVDPAPVDPAEAASKRFMEVEMCLDTVALEADREELVLVWRRPIKVSAPTHPEIEAVYIAEEELAEEPAPAEVHYARFRELRPERISEADAMQADIDAQMKEASKLLRESNVDPKLSKQFDETKDPKDALALLMQFAQTKIRELEEATAKMKGGTPPR